MSKVSSVLGGDDSASDAAQIQSDSADRAAELQRQTAQEIRADLTPFREVGQTDLQGLGDLVTNPQAQLDFINNNPFFEALTGKASDNILNNAAARGKAGSGGTVEELQNSLLSIGTDLVNQNITQRQNLANFGVGAAAQSGEFAQNSTDSISDLITQSGNAQASGIIGQQQGDLAALGNIANIGASIVGLCDVRAKENIQHVGYLHNGNALYSFNYIGDDKPQINVMAQDLEKPNPEAVLNYNGVKYVDLEKAWF